MRKFWRGKKLANRELFAKFFLTNSIPTWFAKTFLCTVNNNFRDIHDKVNIQSFTSTKLHSTVDLIYNQLTCVPHE